MQPAGLGLAHLPLRHHSAVELVDRAQRAGLVARAVDPGDHRVVRVRLTPEGELRLAGLAATHLAEIEGLRARLAVPGDGPGRRQVGR